jgi:hypothetical protein
LNKELTMPRLSMNIAQPIFRHFFPIAKDFVFHTPTSQTSWFFNMSMKELLIQGAYPLDQHIISKADDVVVPQFQGGYRCELEILTQPQHGTVKISDDRMGFAYRPLLTYRGGDAFSYRLRNVVGQVSNACCISLFVRV